MIPMGPGSAIRQAFDAVGAEMNMIDTTGRMRYRLAHGDYDLPPGGGGLYGMIEFALEGDVDEAQALFARFREAMGWWTPLDSITMREWLDQYTDNEKVKSLFNGYTAALMGVGIHEMGAGTFFQFLKGSSKGSQFGLAAEGNGDLMASLAGGLESHGATILRRTQVNEIVVENNRVVGVRVVTDGQERVISTDYVLSNTGPDRTVELAGGDDAFESSYIARLRTQDHAATIFHVSFLMDRPLIDDLDGAAAPVMNLDEAAALPGAHNAQNAAAAYAATRRLGVAGQVIADAVRTFPGLPHRQELVGIVDDIRYINDSKATNGESAARAVSSYGAVYWIAGGLPKAGGIDAVAPYFSRILHAFLIGDAAAAFAQRLDGHVPCSTCDDLESAVRAAQAMAAEKGPADAVVLLSPACASFDQFANFEARGEAFRTAVSALQYRRAEGTA